ncbi:aminoglycoside phosphotransferase family protein [Virgibacillus ndiopensis]|uniref:aminoglycoside phosphotransferase family protein n=1 Tax=Virgibacillus ndiopensis TaxID=2004408 RepID=UPI001FE6D784|nr:phosphotransferase [Virgibacillus ndiopensis]
MEDYIRNRILLFNKANSIQKLNKGFSFDEKYVVDDQYLIRLFPITDIEHRRTEFNNINKLAAYSEVIPKAIAFNQLKEKEIGYMILTFLPGKDGENALKDLSQQEQYDAGFQAGIELRKLHEMPAPLGYPSWNQVKKRKNDRYMEEFKKLQIDYPLKTLLEAYIRKNEHLMQNRPNTFQHDDFHPANLLIHNNVFSGIIDFQRIDWGDPIHDLHKLGFFSKRVSIPFTRGIISGYHKHTNPDKGFWDLYGLYSAMHIVSALVWGKKLGIETYNRMLNYSLDVIRDHRNFERNIPEWYK